MENDIVARLRDCTCIPHGEIVREAADEIERLRARAFALEFEVERLKRGGCARDQATTQYCAEAASLQAEVERLRAQLESTELKLREQTARSVEAAFQIRSLVRQLNHDQTDSSPQ